MFQQAVSMLIECIESVFQVFLVIFSSGYLAGAFQFVFGMFVVVLSFRFLLVPLIHGDVFHLASDRASKARQQYDYNSERRRMGLK